MSAAEPRDGKEAAPLAYFERMPPERRDAFVDAVERLADGLAVGQPAEDCLTELLVEMGWVSVEARQKARKALRGSRGQMAGRFGLISGSQPPRRDPGGASFCQ